MSIRLTLPVQIKIGNLIVPAGTTITVHDEMGDVRNVRTADERPTARENGNEDENGEPERRPRQWNGARTTYKWSARNVSTVADLNDLELRQQVHDTARLMLRHPDRAWTRDDLADATGISRKSMESVLTTMRNMRPRLVRSSND